MTSPVSGFFLSQQPEIHYTTPSPLGNTERRGYWWNKIYICVFLPEPVDSMYNTQIVVDGELSLVLSSYQSAETRDSFQYTVFHI